MLPKSHIGTGQGQIQQGESKRFAVVTKSMYNYHPSLYSKYVNTAKLTELWHHTCDISLMCSPYFAHLEQICSPYFACLIRSRITSYTLFKILNFPTKMSEFLSRLDHSPYMERKKNLLATSNCHPWVTVAPQL